MSTYPPPLIDNTATLSSLPFPGIDDLYEYYDPDAEIEPQPEPESYIPLSRRRATSTSSGGPTTLPRTSRLQQQSSSQRGKGITSPVGGEGRQPAHSDRPGSPARSSLDVVDLLLDRGRPITPQIFRRILRQESLSVPPNSQISRSSHRALLFALEAIRSGDGSNYKELSSDREEESARMSEDRKSVV